jgi:hypothetical protein
MLTMFALLALWSVINPAFLEDRVPSLSHGNYVL